MRTIPDDVRDAALGDVVMSFREFLDRYGPTATVLLGLALIISMLPGNAKPSTIAAGAGAASNSLTGADGTGANGSTNATAVGASGLTGGATAAAAASSAGQVASGLTGGRSIVQVGKGKCRGDGRQYGISRYMPPCVAFSGDNGGVTGKGVTKDEVLVVRYLNQADPATQAILQSIRVADDPSVITRALDALFNYANAHYMTYGRKVRYIGYPASGPDKADENMKADAKDIAERIKPFAVFTLGPKVFAQELAQRGVVCSCTVSLSSDFSKENPPYIWGSLPTSTEYAQHIAEYIGKRVANKPAKWAGDEFYPTQAFKTKQRTFGLIYLVGQYGIVDPEGDRFYKSLVAELARYNVKLTAKFEYTYDPSDAAPINAMVTTMKAAKVTTVLMWVDPLYPILITRQATNQQYFPEWFNTGSGLSDTSAAGRQYDQQQWRHSFGITPLWVTWTEVAQSAGYREFHHGMPGMKPGDEGVLINIYRDPVQTIFTGIQLAGPRLNADTFAQGMFNYPRTGGIPSAPLVFRTRAYPTAIKDFAEIYYDINAQGKDERGEQGSGLVMKSNAGRRYVIGTWPVGTAQVFGDAAGTHPIAISAAPPGGATDPPHEQDGHTHQGKCMSCT
jgi:hypothetical protein